MTFTDYLPWVGIALSLVALLWNMTLQNKLAAIQQDVVVLGFVNSTTMLLKEARSLAPEEQDLLSQLLEDWDYFTPPRFIKNRGIGTKPSTATRLQRHFADLSRKPR